jgi:hypothetical protein
MAMIDDQLTRCKAHLIRLEGELVAIGTTTPIAAHEVDDIVGVRS